MKILLTKKTEAQIIRDAKKYGFNKTQISDKGYYTIHGIGCDSIKDFPEEIIVNTQQDTFNVFSSGDKPERMWDIDRRYTTITRNNFSIPICFYKVTKIK